VPAENVHALDGAIIGLESFPSPGHASHHVCYLDPDGTLYAGDAAGVRVLPGRSVMPPTPPPDVDVAAWQTTFDEIARRDPARLALIHFGVAEDVSRHLEELELRLLDWAESVEGGASEEEFVEYALAELSDSGEDAGTFTQAMPLWQSYRGLARWAEKQATT
jgi:glyoxylase-like metal-dependent hydrolase (beta-lactamase superfamily II)